MKASLGYVQLKEIDDMPGIQMAGNNLKEAKVVSLGSPPAKDSIPVPYKKGDIVLFDTNKSLKHNGFWYLKADTVFGYEENK